MCFFFQRNLYRRFFLLLVNFCMLTFASSTVPCIFLKLFYFSGVNQIILFFFFTSIREMKKKQAREKKSMFWVEMFDNPHLKLVKLINSINYHKKEVQILLNFLIFKNCYIFAFGPARRYLFSFFK